MLKPKAISGWQWSALILLRVIIGWHFLYEGMAKLFNPYWSSASYLVEANWLFSRFFNQIIASPSWLKVVDMLNIWGQIAIGLGLIVGFLVTPACVAGVVLLALYYVANPPLVGLKSSIPVEGSYLVINKNLVEMAALLVLSLFPTGRVAGIDRLVFGSMKPQREEAS